MNKSSELCDGCLRTLDEVAQWSRLSDSAKRGVWAMIRQRIARQTAEQGAV
jgi:predicted Fe-S protein YdhL (DUF1289 family)